MSKTSILLKANSGASSRSHNERVRRELRQVGATSYGLTKFASKYLYRVIHGEEHVRAAVYGRYREDEGQLGFNEGMLVATDYRIIFLDHKPGYTAMKELTYDSVSGVQYLAAGPFAAVTLHTRIGDFTLRYANRRCAKNFVDYIEIRRIDSGSVPVELPAIQAPDSVMDAVTLEFLRTHDIGVCATLGRDGVVHSAAVHYLIDETDSLYILTKSDTQKAHDVMYRHSVAMTFYDVEKLQTVQLQGGAYVESDPELKKRVFRAAMQPHRYGSISHMPPVSALHDGAFMVIRVTPTTTRFSDFSG
jgi:uncharacterized pyridoxamine 5'-phosphate oxidase family protein